MAATAPTSESIIIQSLQEEISLLWKANEEAAHQMAFMLKRIKTLEGQPKEGEKAKALVDALYDSLLASGQRGMTYAQIAVVLKISKSRAKQLNKSIENDGRFAIMKHPTKRNMHVICIKKVMM